MAPSARHQLRALLVNTSDSGGGAEAVSVDLRRALVERGHLADLIVGSKTITETIPLRLSGRPDNVAAEGNLNDQMDSNPSQRNGQIGRILESLRNRRRRLRHDRGYEDFDFPATQRLTDLATYKPDIVHLHNLHGGYFDLRELPSISSRFPIAVTLHDQWMMTGHCAYSLDCQRWQEGCGRCPYLDVYPAIPADGTRENLRRKRRIYSRSALHVSAPSQWLLDQVPASVLGGALISKPRLIPNGVDREIFSPADRARSRHELGLPRDVAIVTSVANWALSNVYKDWPMLRDALSIVSTESEQPTLAYAIGEAGPRTQAGTVSIEGVARIDDRSLLAHWYRASDLLVQPSAADNHPLTVLEALSCGTPVVATAVGGIPEQIKHLHGVPGGIAGGVDGDAATGVLVTPGDIDGLAKCLEWLLDNPSVRAQLGSNAARDAKVRFGFDRYIDNTMAWYREILGQAASRVGRLIDEWSQPT